MLLILWVVFVTAAVLFLYGGPHRRFRRAGVRHLTPLPLLGDLGRVVFRFQHVLDNMDRLYGAFPGERFIGITELIQPVIVIRDPELVKRITIEDFDHFQNHGIVVDKDVDEVFGRNLFSLKGQDWKNMRSNVSPLFTGSKLRSMFPYLMQASDNIFNRIKKGMKESGKNYMDLDMYDVTTRFVNDVFASIIYGLKLDSQNQHNSEFYEMAKSVSRLKYTELLKFLGYQMAPNVMKTLNITMFSKKSSDFFRELLNQTLKNSKTHNMYQPVLIETFLQSKNEWTESDLLAQIIGLLVAGFAVTASSMTFLVHMLALHPDVQEKLLQEIKGFDEKNGGNLDYDCIQQMTYLDMVILGESRKSIKYVDVDIFVMLDKGDWWDSSELLRNWASSAAERVCVKDYNLGRPNDSATKDYIIRKGEIVRIGLRSIHHDSEYFPEPHKFDPERFSTENRPKIRPGTYNPFGAGPRNCVGSRFSIFAMKVLIINLLQQMEILPCEKTSTNIQLSLSAVTALCKDGHWVRFRPRQQNKNV